MGLITLLELGNNSYPNHTYLVSDDKSKLYAYIKEGTSTKIELKKPVDFSTRNRKFKVLKEALEGKVVVGSKGDKYVVTSSSCTCTGFKYRGSCKHLELV